MTATAIDSILAAHPVWEYRIVSQSITCAGPGCEWEVYLPLTHRAEDAHRAHQAEAVAAALAPKPVELTTKPLTMNSTQRPEVLRRFNSDMEGGKLTLVHDSGLHRYLTFRPRKGNFCWFDIITSPGQLTIRGDMGDFVFVREPDMLRDFFSRDVNPHYWREKLVAQDVSTPAWQYERDLFRKYVAQHFWDRRTQYTPDVAAALWEEIRQTGPLDDWTDAHDATSAWNALTSFTSEQAPGYRYEPDYEEEFHDYSFQYLWCCHAVLSVCRAYREYHKPKTLEGATA
ncbi:hypothetical protein ArV1_056 [Arthrobacter phage vB_ArtM-ArV1]|uniref:Uncharacterized protein n=1 Tax=Arthrobacter phage vB_ArtM-ArV1 TaxID=1566993 RepID=A0A0A7HET5_9CAUD|nr:hypothetical protein ArV1_056 [Arthrobacter phage vB_ArtM-ArV1]AIZ01744.1 hypothetical protein ArV1_056 [Arthrobacter phage vB_ArtM-ArV1]